jgi:spore cortex formation protein SpoVR/YcgB (stage V sporulation)
MRLFAINDRTDDPVYSVAAIHDEMGYRRVRNTLARAYELGASQPDIQATGAALSGDRTLYLCHWRRNGVRLHPQTRDAVLRHVERLWGHDVVLEEKDV